MYFLLFILVISILIAYFTRAHWVPKIGELRERFHYTRLPFFRSEDDGSFEQNIEEGLTSSTFDLHQNLLGGGKQLFSQHSTLDNKDLTQTSDIYFLLFVRLSMGSMATTFLAYAKPGQTLSTLLRRLTKNKMRGQPAQQQKLDTLIVNSFETHYFFFTI